MSFCRRLLRWRIQFFDSASESSPSQWGTPLKHPQLKKKYIFNYNNDHNIGGGRTSVNYWVVVLCGVILQVTAVNVTATIVPYFCKSIGQHGHGLRTRVKNTDFLLLCSSVNWISYSGIVSWSTGFGITKLDLVFMSENIWHLPPPIAPRVNL